MNTFDDRITPEDVHFMRTWGIYSEPEPLRVVTYNNRPVAVYKQPPVDWACAIICTIIYCGGGLIGAIVLWHAGMWAMRLAHHVVALIAGAM